MTSIPLEAGVAKFVPPSLKNLVPPPTFRLHTAGRREKARYQVLLIEEGLQFHGSDAMRDELMRGMAKRFDEETFATFEPRVRAYWDALDQHDRKVKALIEDWQIARAAALDAGNDVPDMELPRFENPDQAVMDELIGKLERNWRPVCSMAADNAMFRKESPRILLSVLLTGWENLGVKFALDNGIVPLETIDLIEEELKAVEEQAVETVEGITPGSAFNELLYQAMRSLTLSEDESKNSASPSRSTSSPKTSPTDGRGVENGLSTASTTSSRKTRKA